MKLISKFVLVGVVLAGFGCVVGCKDPDTARSEDLGKAMSNQANAMKGGPGNMGPGKGAPSTAGATAGN